MISMWYLIYFCMTTAHWNIWPQHVAFFISLLFSLAAPNLQTAVLCLKSNVYVNWRNYFLALGFLADIDGLCVIWLLLVHTSDIETSAASIIALHFCWLSHLPAVLHNFLMFSRNLCSYKALLLNYWSTPMATMCFSGC